MVVSCGRISSFWAKEARGRDETSVRNELFGLPMRTCTFPLVSQCFCLLNRIVVVVVVCVLLLLLPLLLFELSRERPTK